MIAASVTCQNSRLVASSLVVLEILIFSFKASQHATAQFVVRIGTDRCLRCLRYVSNHRPRPSGHFCCCDVASASPATVLFEPGTMTRPVEPGVLRLPAAAVVWAHPVASTLVANNINPPSRVGIRTSRYNSAVNSVDLSILTLLAPLARLAMAATLVPVSGFVPRLASGGRRFTKTHQHLPFLHHIPGGAGH